MANSKKKVDEEVEEEEEGKNQLGTFKVYW